MWKPQRPTGIRQVPRIPGSGINDKKFHTPIRQAGLNSIEVVNWPSSSPSGAVFPVMTNSRHIEEGHVSTD